MTAELLTSFARIGELSFWLVLFGIGPVLLLLPGEWRRSYLLFPISAMSGLCLLALAGVYQVHTDKAVVLPRLWLSVFSITCLGIAAIRFRPTLGQVVRYCVPGRDALILAALVFGCILALWPSFMRGGNQTYRIGPDSVGYAITGQFLKEGGVRPLLVERVIRETGRTDLHEALRANPTMLNFNASIACEFILKSQRAGYPAVLAQLGQLMNLRWVVEWQMLALFFPLLASSSTFYWLLREKLNVPSVISALWASALVLNSNWLNSLWEGQHAQVFAVGLSTPLFVIWYRCRSQHQRPDYGELAVACLLFAGMFAAYSECFLVMAVLWLLMVITDLLLTRKLPPVGMWYFAGAAFLSVFITGPYFLDWLDFIFRHVKNVSAGGGGYWQPQWASPTEILGYVNLYQSAVAVLEGRNAWSIIGISLSSLLIIHLAVFFLVREAKVHRAYFFAPIAFVLVIFGKSFFLDHLHNYNFMKSYTLALVPIVLLHIASLHGKTFLAILARFSTRPALVQTGLSAVAAAVICLSGAGYLRQYINESHALPKGARELGRGEQSQKLRDGAVLLNGVGGIGNMLLAGYLPLNWLNLGWSNSHLAPHAGKAIYVVTMKRDLVSPGITKRKHQDAIVFENADVIVIKTGRLVEPNPVDLLPIEPVDRTNPLKPVWPNDRVVDWNLILEKNLSAFNQ